jgi:DNA-binding IscR family transcriptional regulator
MKVIELLEGKKLRSQCVLGSAECSEKNICLIRSQCGPIRKEVERIFSEMDLRQLLEEAVDSSAQPLPGLFAESTWADEG